ncbi:MAG: 2-phosphosulfolactate phosphatase [Bacteroidota bacterium]
MSLPKLEVCLSPLLFNLYQVEHKNVVVIDVLRATSTICAALSNGAKSVIPVTTIEECQALKTADNIIACEREGKIAAGFEHGNSPLEYTPAIIQDKSLVLTTTNGTRCINMSKGADLIITGSFLNLSAVTTFLAKSNKDTILFCSGWKDQFSLEDTLFAGAVIDQLQDQFNFNNDSSFAAWQLYKSAKDDLLNYVKNSSHYQRLAGYGIEKDIAFCVATDTYSIVPYLNSTNQLTILH